ncbi:glycerophosphodiester phosphodiesterase family protein [Labilibacter sediminis]|nr:glycerophosphodiester phosphodiesterase family protein [Labilibacter sediminis]
MAYKLIAILLIICSFNLAACTQQSLERNKNQNNLEKITKHLKNSTDNYVMVAAHRGDWRNAPENSIQAIKNCIKMRVDIVEIDVRMTKDSILVLMHDKTIDRTTTGKGKITDWTLDSLKNLQLKNGCGIRTHHNIPTLKEAMLVTKGKILVNLDKCSGYMDLAYNVLKETGTVNQVIFKGSKDIDQVKEKYGDLLSEIIYMPIIKENTPYLSGHVDDFIIENKPLAFEVLFNDDDSPMFEMIQNIKNKGSRIWVNTLWESLCGEHTDDLAIDDPDGSWGWVIDKGANIIQTDRPELLLEYLREKGLHD